MKLEDGVSAVMLIRQRSSGPHYAGVQVLAHNTGSTVVLRCALTNQLIRLSTGLSSRSLEGLLYPHDGPLGLQPPVSLE